jgi:pSer/pThr/pTyr-binding forkhead associated (FHA) protein
MEAQIIITRTATGTSQTVTVPEGERIVLGRSLASPAALEGSNISREHFAVTTRAGKLTLEDLSSNGTWLNGERLPRASEIKVRAGDLIEIFGYRIEVSGNPASQTSVLPSQKDTASESTSSESSSRLAPIVRLFRALELPEILGIVAGLCCLLLFIIYSLQ